MTSPPPAWLDWHDNSHFGADRPCVLCGRLTPLRSHAGESAHKVCAEDWLTQHPGETRFVSDAPRTRRKTSA